MRFSAKVDYVRNGVQGTRWTTIEAASEAEARANVKSEFMNEHVLNVELEKKNEPPMTLTFI